MWKDIDSSGGNDPALPSPCPPLRPSSSVIPGDQTGGFFTAPVSNDTTSRIRKMIASHLAIVADVPESDVNPSTPAINATMRKMTAHFNMI
jgi:hypothetical protein